MLTVEIRWRPSGGRGEYEHVPQNLLLGRRVAIEAVSIPSAVLFTDARGKIRDGKPRLRRDDPNNRSLLNVHQLVAALALLPDPIREDKGQAVLPLRSKNYVISAIKFDVKRIDDGVAICAPQQLRVLHDNSEIDLTERLVRIGSLISRNDLQGDLQRAAARYQTIVRSEVPVAELRQVADELIALLNVDRELAEALEVPSEKYVDHAEESQRFYIDLDQVTADETNRRLVSHYKIDRSIKIRNAKLERFESQYGRVYCENCSFDFEQKYGERGKRFIEVHHSVPLAALLPNTITNLNDLILLCSNCHRMVHRNEPLLDIPTLKAITNMQAAKPN